MGTKRRQTQAGFMNAEQHGRTKVAANVLMTIFHKLKGLSCLRRNDCLLWLQCSPEMKEMNIAWPEDVSNIGKKSSSSGSRIRLEKVSSPFDSRRYLALLYMGSNAK